jgi:hypothetical protein
VTSLTRPAVVASLLVVTALVLHPALRTEAWLPERDGVLAALLLLATVALALRATRAPWRPAPALLAAGALLVVGAVGGDGVRGHRGTLSLVPGQARSHFDEIGPQGQSLGLRPLGFTIGLDQSMPGAALALVLPGEAETVVLTPERAVSSGGVRFGRPRVVPTGAAARLRVGISGGGEDVTVDVAPGRPAQAGDLTIALEDYFPDFALDDQRQPFTRSREPRNPAALLALASPSGTFRVFVLRAMPGVHRVEALDRSFALRAVEPEVSAEIQVHREPFAAVALLGGLLALAGVVLDRGTR